MIFSPANNKNLLHAGSGANSIQNQHTPLYTHPENSYPLVLFSLFLRGDAQMECMDCRYRGSIQKSGTKIVSWGCKQRNETVYNNDFTRKAHCWYRK